MGQVSRPVDRRYTPRVRVELFLNQYIRDRPLRALAINVSATGILLRRLVERHVPRSRIVSVEFEIPGTDEVVWASAEPRFDTLDEDFQQSGLTFVNMARKHEKLLREFVSRKATLALERTLRARGAPGTWLPRWSS
jgi:c-di-GMP-binding flagellar brake protein YcgR